MHVCCIESVGYEEHHDRTPHVRDRRRLGPHRGCRQPRGGPSDPAGFEEVYNLGNVPTGSIFDIPSAISLVNLLSGGPLGFNYQLNLFDGGEINGGSGYVTSDSDSENADLFHVELNLFGGSIDAGLVVGTGTTANFFGSVATSNLVTTGGTVNVFDGTIPLFAGGDSTVNVLGGAIAEDSATVEASTVNIAGGSIGDSFAVNRPGLLTGISGVSTLNISGGSVGDDLTAWTGSTVNITGGTVGDSFRTNVLSDPPFSVLGPDRGSTVNISGGSIGDGFRALPGSTVNISGGTIASMNADSGSTVNFFGGAFQLNGSPVSDLSGGLPDGVLTGLLEDGTVLFIDADGESGFSSGTITLESVAVAPSTNPGVLSSGTFTKGVRAGETLTVNGSGTLSRNFAVVGGTINIEGGSIGTQFTVASSEANISGGTIGDDFRTYVGSTVNISGGTIGDDVVARGATVNIVGGTIGDDFFTSASTLSITGGTIGDDFRVVASTLNISGGTFGDDFRISESTVDISGGTFGDGFAVETDTGSVFASTVNLSGTSFILDGVELADLEVGETFLIDPTSLPFDREVMLTGVLADGSAFEFELFSTFFNGFTIFDEFTQLSVTVVPAPGAAGLLVLAGFAVFRRQRS